MQAPPSSQQRGLSYRQSKREQDNSQPESIPAEPGWSLPPVKDAIARSMSRYKGNRQPKPNTIAAPPLPTDSVKRSLLLRRQDSRAPSSIPFAESSQEHLKSTRSRRTVKERNGEKEELRPRKISSPMASPIEPTPVTQSASSEIQEKRHTTREPNLRRANIEVKTNGLDIEGAQRAIHDGKLQPQPQASRSLPKGDGISGSNSTERYDTREQRNRRAMNSNDNPPMLKTSPKKSFTERMTGHISKYHSSKSNNRTDLKKTISTPVAVGAGGEISSPSFDAPISAVNAGERRVIAKYKDYLVSLPVTPSTTSVDIIRATAEEKPELTDTQAFVVLESFKQVGLERPLRRYERIRDVLNSWDHDAQNTLIIVPSPTNGNDDDLDARSVPKAQPTDTSVNIYYSQKPGHWNKRWITLRSDGQVVVKKNRRETTNICHLSDFDIYVPTPRQIAKKIKPPKKVCFAVKSQQKSSMFLSTVNFVHFFSTNDRALAASWYKVVQQWRSWYLVNKLGEGQIRAKDTFNISMVEHQGQGLTDTKLNEAHGHLVKSAVYQVDSRTPQSPRQLSGTNARSKRSDSNESSDSANVSKEFKGISTGQKPARNRSAPPISFPKKLTKDAATGNPTTNTNGPSFVQAPIAKPESEPFATTGLLGRTYSQRQKALASREKEANALCIPKPTPIAVSANGDVGGLKRNSSQRQKPKPLVDLTPQYQEPPQHSRKGRGIIPSQIPAGGLVDIATSPEIAIPIPPTKAWRRTDVGSGDDSPTHRPGTSRGV